MKNTPPFKLRASALAVMTLLSLVPQLSMAAQETDCTTSNARVWGRVIGVGLGALIGNKVGDGKVGAAIVGAALGGFIGDFVGKEIDRRNCELDKIAKAHNVEITHDKTELKAERPPEEGIDAELVDNSGSGMVPVASTPTEDALTPVTSEPLESGKVEVTTWKGELHFEVGSARLTPKAREYFAQAARQYSVDTVGNAAVRQFEREAQQKNQRVTEKERQAVREGIRELQGRRPIVLVGHTDDAGDSEYNQALSEKRSRAVAEVFKQNGIPADRLYFRGAGETDPIASNMTDEGRARNRRVEVIELESKDKLLAFATLKKPKYEYYRPTQAGSQIVLEDNGPPKASKDEPGVDNIAISDVDASPKTQSGASKSTARSTPFSKDNKASVVEGSRPTGNAVAKPRATALTQANVVARQGNNPLVEKGAPRQSVKAPTGFDLGGSPADNAIDASISSALGRADAPAKGMKGTFGGLSSIFVKSAHASEDSAYSVPCTRDRARYAGDYMSLASGKSLRQQYKTADYAPGLYNTVWSASIGNHYAGIAPVAVLRGNYEPASNPALYLYANTTSPDKNAKAAWKDSTQVTVYPAEKGILYRVFSKEGGAFVCADIVMPLRAPFQSPAGKLYYRQGGSLYEAVFIPAMLGSK
jgi:outer membrane protein OmpA-like peptidoglycan-associated protein